MQKVKPEHVRAGRRVPDYICDGRTVNDRQPMCQWISGEDVDEAVSELLVEIVTPVAIEATLAVQQELQARLHEVERLRKEQVERARYAADLAQHRYMRVDPDNRLVADTLEADWNQKLRALQEAQQEYQQQRQKDSMTVEEELRRRLHTLATDFPGLWRDPNTPDRERKRLAHLLLQDVTLIKREQLLIHIRFPGGATRTLELPRPRRVTVTPRSVITEVDRLPDDHSPEAIANILNARGSVSGYGKPFTGRMINRVRVKYGLKSRFERLRAKGMLTREEMAQRLGINPKQVAAWRAAGLLQGHLCTEKDEYLYEDPGPDPPRKAKGVRLSKRLRFENVSHRPSEVQCEA
jgi:DNA-binding transcriptional regulator YiaG